MYTITITDLITKEVTEVCITDCIDNVESITSNLISALPHYLEVDFQENEHGGLCLCSECNRDLSR